MTDAYAAGLIDGEGCITISQCGGGRWFAVRIDVGMSAKALPLLERMQKRYGGSIRKTRARSRKWEAAFAWGIFGFKAASFLALMLPSLVLKEKQARLALRLQEIIDGLEKRANGNAIWTDDARRRATMIHAAVKKLNAKGPTQTTPVAPGWFARLVGDTWVTPQLTLFGALGSEPYSGRWPRSGMTRSGIAYRLPPLVPLTAGIGRSLWATPTASDCANRTKSTYGRCLPREVAMRPTPTTSMMTIADQEQARYSGTDSRRPSYSEAGSGSLNPQWVEWLMGFPVGWSDLED
jgi:hypothetical protein